MDWERMGKWHLCWKPYQELGFYQRRWVRRLCLLFKVFSTVQPYYIYNLLPSTRTAHRHVDLFNKVSCIFEYFKNSFIPNVVNPFHVNVPFLYSLKMSENLWFSDVFRGYKSRTLAWKGLNNGISWTLTSAVLFRITYFVIHY